MHKFTKAERSEILGRSLRGDRVSDARADRSRMFGTVSVVAGIAALVAAGGVDALAKPSGETAVPPRLARRVEEFRKKLASSACLAPALLRRQTDYRLPHQRAEMNMVEIMAGSDNCPGTPVPSGVYTAAAPYTDSGTTIGANDTVQQVNLGCVISPQSTYTQVAGPDQIYSFTIGALGANPQISVTPNNTSYDTSIYILSSTGTACPAGTDNVVTNCIAGNDTAALGGTEAISAAQISSLPLNTQLYLFVDSFYETPGQTGNVRHQGPYTLTIKDITIGQAGPAGPDAVVDMDGDGKTDYVVLRNMTGGATGDVAWFTSLNASGPIAPQYWGNASDKFITEDFDGDRKDDYAVFRPGEQGYFYIIRSSNSTFAIEPFGQWNDDPSVVGDYTGDGAADLAVYREGIDPGSQSTWYFRPLSGVPGGFSAVPWGQAGDYPAPGDYDGDGKNDFVVQRAAPDGVSGQFWVKTAAGQMYNQVFGLKFDSIVPGDYDGDGKTDFAVVRNEGSSIRWAFKPSGGPASVAYVTSLWGDAATDAVAQGDYDGDGKTDYAIWRPGSPSTFYVMTVDHRIYTRTWGEAQDYPLANYNVR